MPPTRPTTTQPNQFSIVNNVIQTEERRNSLPLRLRDNTSAHIQHWLSRLPSRPQEFDAANLAPLTTAAHYEDWLSWRRYLLITYLQTLDACEHKYRDLGLRVHCLQPWQGEYHPRNAPIFRVKASLMQVLGDGKRRREQAFFIPWFSALRTAHHVHAEVQALHHPATILAAQEAYRICRALVDTCKVFITEAHRSLVDLEARVSQFEGLAGFDTRYAPDRLDEWAPEDRALYLTWLGSFPEVVENHQPLHQVASRMASGVLGPQACWSGRLTGMASTGGAGGDASSRLGAEWLRSRAASDLA